MGSLRPLAVVCLVLALLGIFAPSADATHFAYGSYKWIKVPGTPRTFTFTFERAYRRSFFSGVNVGATINVGGTFEMRTNGNSKLDSLSNNVLVLAVYPESDWFTGRNIFNYTFSSDGVYKIYYSLAARLSTLLDGNNDKDVRMTGIIDTSIDRSPETTGFPREFLTRNYPAYFTVPGVSNVGLPLTYSFSTTSLSALTQPVPQSPAMVLNSNTGAITWTPTREGLHATQFLIHDGYNTVPLDMIFSVSNVCIDPAKCKTNPCSMDCGFGECNPATQQCQCPHNFEEPDCMICTAGNFLRNDTTLGKMTCVPCSNEACPARSHDCLPTGCNCKPGWDVDTGCTVCSPDHYGTTCAYCLAETTCSGRGLCVHGTIPCYCLGNFDGDHCQQCKSNYYPAPPPQSDPPAPPSPPPPSPLSASPDPCSVYCDWQTTCSGLGSCNDTGQCQCIDGRTGANCSECVGPENDYYGQDCHYCHPFICNGQPCSNNDINNPCDCGPRFAGTYCQACADYHFGFPDCTECTEATCNHRGSCTQFGTCVCDGGFDGLNCEKCKPGFYGPECSPCPSCGSGTCFDRMQGDGSCVCLTDTAGSNCQFTRENACHDHGSPKSDGTCLCDEGWAEPHCQQCADFYFTPELSCQRHCQERVTCGVNGACDSEGLCQCDPGYARPLCNTCDAVNNFYPASASPLKCQYCHALGTCYNHGHCSNNGSCLCDAGYELPDCWECSAGYFRNTLGACEACPVASNGEICGGRGVCRPNTYGCVCEEPHWGADCSAPIITSISPVTSNLKFDNQLFVYGTLLAGMGPGVSYHSVLATATNTLVEGFFHQIDFLGQNPFLLCYWHGVDRTGPHVLNITVQKGGFSRTFSHPFNIPIPLTLGTSFSGQLSSSTDVMVFENNFGPAPLFYMLTDPTEIRLASVMTDSENFHHTVTIPALLYHRNGYTVVGNRLVYRMEWAVGSQRGQLAEIVYRMPTLTFGSFVGDILTFKMSDIINQPMMFSYGGYHRLSVYLSSTSVSDPPSAHNCHCSLLDKICKARLFFVGGYRVPFNLHFFPSHADMNFVSNTLYLDYPDIPQPVVTGCPLQAPSLHCESTGIDIITITGANFGEEFGAVGPRTSQRMDIYFDQPTHPCTDIYVITPNVAFRCQVPRTTEPSMILVFRHWNYDRSIINGTASIQQFHFTKPEVLEFLVVSSPLTIEDGNVLNGVTSGMVRFRMRGLSRFFNGGYPSNLLRNMFRFWLTPYGSLAPYNQEFGASIIAINLVELGSTVELTVMLPPLLGSGHRLRGAFTVDDGVSDPFFVESALSPGTISYTTPQIIPNTLCDYPGGAVTNSLQSLSTSGSMIAFNISNAAYIPLGYTEWHYLPVVMVASDPDFRNVHVPCVVIESLSTPQTIVCRTPSGEGRDFVFAFQDGENLIMGSDRYHYPTRPKITGVSSSGCTNQGSAVVDCPTDAIDALEGSQVLLTITGTDFDEVQTATVGTEECQVMSHEGNVVVCSLPRGTGLNKSVILSGNQISSSPAELVSYAFPTITGLVGCGTASSPCGTRGEMLIQVHGINLYGSSILIGGATCELETLESTHVVCVVPSGTGSDLPLMAIQNDGGASEPVMFYYVKCAMGRYSTAGDTTCYLCNEGKYSDLEGLSFCMECQAGSYSSQSAVTACSFCEAGRFASATNQSLCTRCSAGKFSGAGASVCDDCQAGTYESGGQCLPCRPGSTNALPGSVECQPCQAGKYMPTPGSALATCSDCAAGSASAFNASSCTPCNAGHYSQSGSSECTGCPSGYFTQLPGQSQCSSCDAGKFALVALATFCEDCAVGKFSRSGWGLCEDCPVGRIASQRGTPSCVSCGSGMFINSTGASVCTPCPSGTFSVSPVSPESPTTQCPACQPGRYQSINGSTACLLCNSGKYSNSSRAIQCRDCEEGSYASSSGSFTRCTLCTAGKFQDLKGQADCQSCPGGYHSSAAGATVCELCSVGTLVSPSATSCLECSPGTFGSSAGNCDPCPIGRFSNVSRTLSCNDCPAGFLTTETGQSTCGACPQGTYSTSGSSRCESCVGGRYAPSNGSSECASCSAGRYSRGVAGVVGIAQCSLCGTGSYISYGGASFCLSCIPGKISNQTGSSECSDCEKGKYQPDSAKSACVPCPRGFFSSSTAQIACVKCMAGSIAPLTGMAECDSCPAGRFGHDLTDNKCLKCPEGFSSSSRSSSCSACSAGKYSNVSGSDNCLHCPSGRYQNEAGQASCKEAPRGSFVSFTGAVNFSPCPAGSFSNTTSFTACDSCEPGSYIAIRGSALCIYAGVGTYVSLRGGMTPVKCEAGSFQNVTGASFCHRCPEGYYQNTDGLTECKITPIGYFSDRPGLVDPLPCEAGTYSNLTGQSECVRCETGRFVDQEAATTCLDCRKGTYSGSRGLSSCVLCSEGSYGAAEGLTECVNCAMGKQAPSPGAEQCVDCGQGTFASSTGNAVCRQCAAGSHQDLTGKSECIPCLPGYAQETPGQASCTICPMGSYALSSAQSNCNPAPVGRFTDTDGSTEAIRCSRGFHQDEEGQTSCKPCAPGSFASSEGLEHCLPCLAGMFSAASNVSACHSCAAGSYQPNPSSSSCLLCNVGSYSASGASVCSECMAGYAPDKGMDQCLDCPGNARTVDQGANCTCLSGFYSVFDTNGRMACPACPSGADCADEGSASDRLAAAAGYWRGNNASLNFLKCRVAEYCLGGLQSTCLGNRNGPLCMLCKPGYQESSDRRCNECPGGGGAPSAGMFVLYAAIILAAVVALCAVILFTDKQLLAQFEAYLKLWIQEHGARRVTNFVLDHSKSKDSKPDADMEMMTQVVQQNENDNVNENENENKNENENENVIPSTPLQPATMPPVSSSSPLSRPSVALSPAYVQKRTLVISNGVVKPADNQSRSGAHRMKIFISFFQIVSTVAFLFDAPWPTLYRKFLSVFDFLNLDLVQFSGASCVWEINFYTQFLVVLISPMVLLICISLLFVGGQWLKLRMQGAALPEHQLGMRLAWAKNLKIFFFVMFLVYPRVSTMTLSLLNCSNVEGRHYLSVDFSIQCYDTRWYNYLVFDIFMILLYPIGFPAFLFYLLRRAQKRSILQRVDVVYYMGFLYQPYNDNAYMFELVEMGHKLILTSLLSLFPSNAQLPLGMAISAVFFIIIVLARPYSNNSDETVHLLAQCNIFLLLFAGWFFTQGEGELDSVADDAFSIFLIITTVIFLLGFVYAAGVRLRSILSKVAGFINERLYGIRKSKSADTTIGEPTMQAEETGSLAMLISPMNPNVKPSRILDMGTASAALDAEGDLPVLERQPSSPSLNPSSHSSSPPSSSRTLSSGLPMLVARQSPSQSTTPGVSDVMPPLSLNLSRQASLSER